MNKRDLTKLKNQLIAERSAIIAKGAKSLEDDSRFDANDFPDEIDCATAEYDNSFTLRIRDREQFYLRKIDKALTKMEKGRFGICEYCREEISAPRLLARPVTTLCIRCKEEQEAEERGRSE